MGKFQKQQAERLYAKQMGAEAAERQRIAALKARGRCVCEVRLVKKRWDGDTLSERRIHEPTCPQWRWWMNESEWDKL